MKRFPGLSLEETLAVLREWYTPKIVIPTAACLSVPTWLAKCPYCDGSLYTYFDSWSEDPRTGLLRCDHAEVHCSDEPDLEDDDDLDEWQEYSGAHNYMPYVYWLPVCEKVERWVNRFYRFPA